MECDRTMISTATGENTAVENEEKKKKNSRGTRRQQRYRAKQKLWQLCELASAQQAAVTDVNIDIRIEDEMGHIVETSVTKVCVEEVLHMVNLLLL